MTRARSLIGEPVDMAVAVGMAVLDLVSRNPRRNT